MPRHWLMFFVLVLSLNLLACQSTVQTHYRPQSPLIQAGNHDFSDQQLRLIEEINRFHQSDYHTVKSVYFEKIHQIDQLSSEQFCSQDMLSLVQEALTIHPTSIVAHSYNRGCGERIADQQRVFTSGTAIQNITEILFRNGAGTSLQTSVATREPYELKYMLQWGDIEVFDVEMVPTQSRNYFLNHAIDRNDGHYIYFYSDIAQVFEATMYSLTGYQFLPEQLSTMLRAEFVRSREPTAKLWLLRQALFQGRDYQVVETLDGQEELSPLETILLSQAHLNQQDWQSFKPLKDRLRLYAGAGVVDAQLLLLIHAMDASVSAEQNMRELFAQHQLHYGLEETAALWARHLLSQKSLGPSLTGQLQTLSTKQKSVLAKALVALSTHYPAIDALMKQRTEHLLSSVSEPLLTTTVATP